MSEVKWIKITSDIFDDEKILLIESLPEADSIIVIWFKLLCLAGKVNNSGVLMLNDKLAYNEKMLSVIFRRKETIISLALKTFEEFGMVEIVDDVITIPNWGKYQNLDQLENKKEYMRNYMKEYREKQKKLICKTNCKTNSKTNVSSLDKDIDKERDIDKELDIKKEKDKEKSSKHKYGEYKNVLLSDDEYLKLQNEFPNDYESRIEKLSSYIASTGKSYKNHLATIRNWARMDKERNQNKQINKTAQQLDESYSMMADWSES